MSSRPPSSAAGPSRSTLKRSAATEADPGPVVDIFRGVSDTDKAGGFRPNRSTLKRSAATEADPDAVVRAVSDTDKAGWFPPSRSTLKRSAATEADPDRAVSDIDKAGGFRPSRSTLKRSAATADHDRGLSDTEKAGDVDVVLSKHNRNLRCSKRPRRAEEAKEEEEAKGGGCGCCRKRSVPEEGMLWSAKRKKVLHQSFKYHTEPKLSSHGDFYCEGKEFEGKRGIEKQPFQFPDFIAATGIQKIRQTYIDKEDSKMLKQKQQEHMHPYMGKKDIDYQPHAMNDSKEHEYSLQNQGPNPSFSSSNMVTGNRPPSSRDGAATADDSDSDDYSDDVGGISYPGDDATEEEDLESKCRSNAATGDEQGNHDISYSVGVSKVKNVKEKLGTSRCQLFVGVGGSHISLQENLNSTSVNMLVKSAFERVGSKAKDFYCTCSGKYLEGQKLLSFYHIQRDSIIKVQHRLRAGSSTRPQTIQCQTWDQVIRNVPRFHVVMLPTGLIDTVRNIRSAKFLSRRIQILTKEVLIALCMIFIRGFCLNGAFDKDHILFHKGRVIFDDVILEVPFTREGGRNDLTRLDSIFTPVFYDEVVGDYPLHARHLLHFLRKCPANVDLTSLIVAAFLTNHCAVQTYIERIATCNELDSMIECLTALDALYFNRKIGAPPNWFPIMNVPAIDTVYSFGSFWSIAEQKWIVLYPNSRAGCVHLARNLFKHAPKRFTREEVEAAFSATMASQDFLANVLQRTAVLTPPAQSPDFDYVKLLGDNMVQ